VSELAKDLLSLRISALGLGVEGKNPMLGVATMTTTSLKRAAVSIFGLLFLAAAMSSASRAQDASPVELVDALNGVFGKHPGMRTSHAKGFCVSGQFTPAADAASLSKAPHFAKPVPVLGRFSMGGGNPKAADNSKGARGLALRFDLGDGASSDLVTISVPLFFAKTPAQVVEFLKVRTPAEGADKPDPEKIKAFSDANPETTRQGAWLNARPVSASYAGTSYFGIHAFTLTNADGKETLIKLKITPTNGEENLTDEEAEAKGPDFLEGELTERLTKGPASFDLVAILGRDGDPTDDPTLRWEGEDDRPTAALGTIEIEALAPNEKCDAITFLPTNLPEGIASPADDLVFPARAGAYVVSLSRRNAPAP
jgi:catalase